MALATKHVPLSAIEPHPNNVRQGDIGAIATSLETHGQYRPIVVQESSNRILAGNHTYKAAAALGWDKIAVVYVDVDDDQAQRIMLVDNRTNDLAGYDEPALVELLEQLSTTPTGLDGSGFTEDDLDDLIRSVNGPAVSPDERYTPEWVFEAMGVEFDIDLAAPPGGIPYIPAKAYWTQEDDSLTKDWTGLFAWCNPPFSNGAAFGRKWSAEIIDGVWLGPMAVGTDYRPAIWRAADALWIPDDIEFQYADTWQGITWAVFMSGHGRGEEAVRNLAAAHPDAGVLVEVVSNG